jgi:hypothetical protein
MDQPAEFKRNKR